MDPLGGYEKLKRIEKGQEKMIESIIVAITVILILYWLFVYDQKERENVQEMYD